jgi:hypothetical protein
MEDSDDETVKEVCSFFLKGKCTNSECRFSHPSNINIRNV